MVKILIVDDNKGIRTVFKKILREFTVLEAGNGIEGIEMYRKHHPNIVVMDIQMPEMNGLEAIRSIKKLDSIAKIIVITAKSDINNSEIFAAGAKKIFIKPIRNKTLLSTIKQELQE